MKLTAIRLLTVVATGLLAGPATAGPTVQAAKPTGARTPVESIDHDDWDVLLKKYVDDNGMVDYRAWKASTADVAGLDRYLQQLAGARIAADSPKNAVMAFWVNAYNAVTVRGILREYPTTSIRNHTAKLWGYNIWKDLKLPVDRAPYSLNDIEHKVLRPMGDFRVHFAIVCASMGCPPLRNEAYRAESLDAQLTDNAKTFFSNPAKFRADTANRTVYLSPIVQWFEEDFGANQAARLRAVAPFLPSPEASGLAESGQANIRYLDYDWGLNEQNR